MKQQTLSVNSWDEVGGETQSYDVDVPATVLESEADIYKLAGLIVADIDRQIDQPGEWPLREAKLIDGVLTMVCRSADRGHLAMMWTEVLVICG